MRDREIVFTGEQVKRLFQEALIAQVRQNFSSDAPFLTDLQSGVFGFTDFVGREEQNVVCRRHLRYLAALLPDLPLPKLAQTLHGVVDNDRLSVHDLRLILDGRSFRNPQKKTNEVPITIIQGVGRMLMQGVHIRKIARHLRVSVDTVTRIDQYLGISQAVADARLDRAIIAVQEGETLRSFASRIGLPRSTAHELMVKARGVIEELEVVDGQV